MAKTGSKRKADAVRFEETEDAADAYNDDAMDDDADDADDAAVAKTTPAANKSAAKGTPGSSGGMMMRSGRKKKRPKPNSDAASAAAAVGGGVAAGATPRKRSKKGADEGGAAGAAAAGKQNGKSNHKDDQGELPGGDEGKNVESDDRKVPHETTREAVAAAQLAGPEPAAEGGEGGGKEGEDQVGATGHARSNGGGNPLLRLAAQSLRLPSRRTPGSSPAAAEGAAMPAGAPPPGGRRLLFQSAQKPPAANGAGNALLMQTRQKQQQQQTQQKKCASTATESPPAAPEEPPQSIQRAHFQQNESTMEPAVDVTEGSVPFFTDDDKEDVVLYTKALFLFFMIFFVFGNLVIVRSREGALAAGLPWSIWNMRARGRELALRYGVETFPATVIVPAADIDDGSEGDGDDEEPPMEMEEEPETVIETVEVTDPALLSNARAALRAHRMNLHDIQRLESSMEELQEGMALLDGSVADGNRTGAKGQRDPEITSSDDSDGKIVSYNQIDGMRSNIAEKQILLSEWERALQEAEYVMDLLNEGRIGPMKVTEVVGALSDVSMIPGTSARLLDLDQIRVPGEGCEGVDYFPLKSEEMEEEEDEDEDEESIEVVGGIDVSALDFASDAPIRLEDAQAARESLFKLAEAMGEALAGRGGPSSHAKRWAQQIVQEELQNEGVDGKPPPVDELHQPIASAEDTAISSKPSDPEYHAYYTARDAIRDIDHALEIEDADRTGKFDYASIVQGASVVRQGPYATSYSLYDTLPLINRILAYTKLRFYGHPPEVALLPTFPAHARGQCWSFPSEFSSSRARQSRDHDRIRGEYATLTVSLKMAITVTEVVVEHVSPNISADPSTAIKEFRVIGFEDGGAYGEPWELGTFKFLMGPTKQAFSIPTLLDGQNLPKLKSVSIAVDSNWGNEVYSCLYRVRVHGA